MKDLQAAVLCVLAGVFAGCAYLTGDTSSINEGATRRADAYAAESRTLSGLATLENAVNDYVKGEGKIPERVEDMVPKYLAEIPLVELGLHGYKDNNRVEQYPSSVIRDGVIDGTQIKDTGRWGYAHNDRQVIVFVDCAQTDSHGKPWYKERGVF